MPHLRQNYEKGSVIISLYILAISAPACGPPQLPAIESHHRTQAVLAGPLCGDRLCECRETATHAGQPQEGKKRFEFRLGPAANKLWVSIGDQILYKDEQQASLCFYVDLPSGQHEVLLHARHKQGIAAGLTVSEMHTTNYWWYDTLRFRCGAPGSCDHAALHAYKASVASYPRNLHDPCGSTKIHNLHWSAKTLQHPSQIGRLDLQFQLDVHSFVPEKPSCSISND